MKNGDIVYMMYQSIKGYGRNYMDYAIYKVKVLKMGWKDIINSDTSVGLLEAVGRIVVSQEFIPEIPPLWNGHRKTIFSKDDDDSKRGIWTVPASRLTADRAKCIKWLESRKKDLIKTIFGTVFDSSEGIKIKIEIPQQ
jgi:hypothetical protein